MELEMQWDGNPHIALEIKTKLGVALPIQVGFKPLTNCSMCSCSILIMLMLSIDT